MQRHKASGDSQYSELQVSDKVDGLIVVDRSVDWVTPMCTQLTYEGMLDEFVGIRNCELYDSAPEYSSRPASIEVDPSLVDPSPAGQPSPNGGSTLPSAKKRKHQLSAAKDPLFAELRDLNFAMIGSRLSKVARRLEGDYGGAKNLKSVSQMKDFVGKLGGLQSEQQSLKLREPTKTASGPVLSTDTGLAESIMPLTRTEVFNKSLEAQQNLVAGYDAAAQLNLIEDLLFQEVPASTVLRLLVLASLTSGGIKPKILESFKRDFLQVYGYHHLPLLIALQDLGLLVKAPATTPHPFPSLRKGLRLVVDDTDDTAPNDVSYVYSGYAPLSIRLVQCVVQKNAVLAGAVTDSQPTGPDGRDSRKELPKAHPIVGWRGLEDALGSIPGATVDVRQNDDSKRDRGELTAPGMR